jgi:hypothetical protein
VNRAFLVGTFYRRVNVIVREGISKMVRCHFVVNTRVVVGNMLFVVVTNDLAMRLVRVGM